ncbi:recombinase family protein [Subtercola sp. RTI3]|uniref:recombinase family protein n=1 Tax=Subtercola sp. RTI3 TaxID=3048639 RepID=UPI002B236D66|nr:recombinase family protein [Subtercola sp. RTI3]MEA9985668.1 recombinase family protein [Subtercola sp. RTI3]
MPKIVAYARVSTDRQDAANQDFEITNYLHRLGFTYDEFVEETISGTKRVGERKLGDLMLRMEAGDTLIVSETSRISRRLSEIFSTIQYFVDRGVIVIAVKQDYKFGDDIQSKVIAFAFGLAAEIERDLISSRTREALARLKSEGVVLGRPHGTGDPTKRKLYGKEEEIMALLDKRISISAIARIHGVNRKTLSTFINETNLVYKLRSRHLENAMKKDGTWKGA